MGLRVGTAQRDVLRQTCGGKGHGMCRWPAARLVQDHSAVAHTSAKEAESRQLYEKLAEELAEAQKEGEDDE